MMEMVFVNNIYPELKDYVEEKSIYKPSFMKGRILDEKNFPLVCVNLLAVTNQYVDLSYSDEILRFKIGICVYANDVVMDEGQIDKDIIGNEITRHISNYFKDNYRVNKKIEFDILNNSGIYQNNILVSGILSFRSKDKYIIYPDQNENEI